MVCEPHLYSVTVGTKILRRMDLFDHSAYFSSYVPVQARSDPLLKHAACACAAKQLSRAKATTTGDFSQVSGMEVFGDSSVDWEQDGMYHYNKSVALLIETMQQNQDQLSPKSPDELGLASAASGGHDGSVQGSTRHYSSYSQGTARLRSDIVVAAVCHPCAQRYSRQELM